MKRKSILLFYLILFLTSCKKNESVPEPELDLSGSYIAARSAVVTSTKMYVKGKVITDWKSINDFVISNQFSPSDTTIRNVKEIYAPNSFYFNLSIKKNNRAIVDLLSVPEYLPFKLDTVKYEGTITIENDELVVRALKPDTIVYWGSYETLPGSYYSIIKPILPKTKYKSIPSNMYPQVRVIETERSLFIIKDNEIYLPMLAESYKKISGQSTSRQVTTKPFLNINIVNPELSTSLGDQDTIVVQEYRLKMIKQK